MRRSRSSTGIPVVKSNLFGAGTSKSKPSIGGRERSRSVTSQRGSSLGVGFKRNPSLERITPLNQKGGSSSSQFNHKKSGTPMTPSTFNYKRSAGGSSSLLRPTFHGNTEASAEKKILQKQITDKKWVLEKYSKVLDFIHNSGVLNPQLATQIKPPTIKTIVEIFGGLFAALCGMTVHLNPQNYAEVIVQNLKLIFKYPGAVTVSSIKTANTMHGWPNFIAITSWLVEKVEIAIYPEKLGVDPLMDDSLRIVSNTVRSCYEKFLGNQTEEWTMPTEDVERFKQDIAEVLGLDDTDLELTKETETYEKNIENANAQIQEIIRNNAELEEEIRYRQEVIQAVHSDTGEKEGVLESQIVEFKEYLQKALEEEKQLKEKEGHLMRQIQTQSCQVKDKKRILKEIENYRKDTERRDAKINEYYRVRDEMDFDYQSKISQLEKEVDAWNVVLTKSCLPEMAKLRLRDKGFHTKEFYEEIKGRQRQWRSMEESFVEESEKVRLEIEDLEKRKKELVATNKKYHDLVAQIKDLEKNQLEILEEMAKTKNSHEETIQRVEEQASQKFSRQTNAIEACQKGYVDLQETFKTLAKEGISEVTKTHKFVREKIVEVREIIVNYNYKKWDHLEQRQAVLTEKLEELEKVKKLLEMVEHEWNEPLFPTKEDESDV